MFNFFPMEQVKEGIQICSKWIGLIYLNVLPTLSQRIRVGDKVSYSNNNNKLERLLTIISTATREISLASKRT